MFFPLFLISFLKLLLFVFLIVLFFNLLLPFFGGAPYLPTPFKNVKKMLKLAKLKTGETLIDLGSGDGRILIEAAKIGAKAIGYEIDPILVYSVRRKIKKLGLDDKIKIYWRSFWKAEIKEADVITFYGITGIMKKMEKKLLNELKSGARVCSYIFSFPNWKPINHDSGIYLYQKS